LSILKCNVLLTLVQPIRPLCLVSVIFRPDMHRVKFD
jgi:hypothetical protein